MEMREGRCVCESTAAKEKGSISLSLTQSEPTKISRFIKKTNDKQS